MRTFSVLGFIFYSFIFGVETNMSALRKVGKKAFIISFSGYFVSLIFSYGAVRLLGLKGGFIGHTREIVLVSQTFFMVTCGHVNDLNISNSEIGRLACAVSLVLDVYAMFATFILFNIYFPFMASDYKVPFMVIGVYFIMFLICRPLILVILSYTPEGRRMKDSHFLAIILIVLFIALISMQVGQPLAVLLFALFLPEEPLTTILSDRLDTFNSSVLLPIFCAMHGFSTDFNSLTKESLAVELLIVLGTIGKLLGTFISSRLFGTPFWSAATLSIIMCSKGFIDIVMLGQFRNQGVRYMTCYFI